ncbi:SET domain-containing protein [Ramaria rubella]|nr:SET domain-containing protein [Ramaria rubella]
MDSSGNSAELHAFLNWFKRGGGNVHSSVGITNFPLMGRGAVALQDLKKDTVIFTLPRSLTLSTRTSLLPSKFGEREWKKFQLHRGWVGLILCMLWEDAAGDDGKWSGYLCMLPDRFETPMFWDEDSLQELQGTTILDRIGKAEAEKDYHEKLLPAVNARPDLFPITDIASHYSLERYHIMGSRILSRSFHLERWEGSDYDDQRHTGIASASDGMDVDTIAKEPIEEVMDQVVDEDGVSGDEDEDEDDPSDVAMVPLADMLNAQYESENAKLCYDSEDLQMVCIRDIQCGEQIWNTYGNPPNSELLRRYGHIDLIPMANGAQGNPADVVDIRADVIVEILSMQDENAQGRLLERIDWWLEEGGDDIFTLDNSLALPNAFISLIRLLSLSKDEWEKTRAKGKVPKPIEDMDILRVAESVLTKKLGSYRTALEEDEALLNVTRPSCIKFRAIVVRLGEKRLLRGALQEIVKKLAGNGNVDKKRCRLETENMAQSGKKARHR